MLVDLYVSEVGTGDAVVLIPGLGYASWFWASQDPLAKAYRLLRIDPRGAGRSPKPLEPYRVEDMASDVARVVETREGPAHLVGHSMGGYVALTLAADRPELVRSLSLVSTSCGGPGHAPVPEDTRKGWLAESHRPPDEYARATMPISFRPGWTDQHPDRYEDLLQSRLEYPTPPESWQAQFAACEAFLEKGADTDAIDVPTLIVHGDADRVVPIDNAWLLADAIPDARLVVFEEAGHLIPIEEPERFNETLVSFWRSTG